MDTTRLCTLVVDDDPASRKFLSALVRHSGSEAIEAVNSGEGLALARTLRPDMVIMDWLMPDLGGAELIRAIKDDGRGYQPYLVVAAPEREESRVAEAMQAGADDFISTPLQAQLVAARLRSAQRLIRLQRVNEHHMARLGVFSEELASLQLRLREMTVTDDLTGLPNRRHALEEMKRAWSVCGRRQVPLSCMVIEMTGLKRVNNRYGHERGDLVLKTAAALIRSLVPSQDVVCRLGGDEFLVISLEADLAGELASGARILTTFRNLGNSSRNGAFGLNIGAAERRPDVAGVQVLLHLAGKGLYQAKRHGGDRVFAVQAVDEPATDGPSTAQYRTQGASRLP